MRKLISISVVLCLALSTVSSAAVFSDDFDAAHGYGTGDVSGTIWDGFYTGGALNVIADAATTTAGRLTMKSSNAGWENGGSALFLYKNVTGDFTATVQFSAPYVDFNTASLMARNGSAASGEDWIAAQALAGYNWGKSPSLRNTDDGSSSDQTSGHQYDSGWLRLMRAGDAFSAWYSPDGITYTQVGGTVTRADLPGTLQVGLAQGTFIGNVGTATFNDFSVEMVSILPYDPTPADGSSLISPDTVLGWLAPEDYMPIDYNVYIATDPNVNAGQALGYTGTTIDPAAELGVALQNDMTYYWRVDAREPNSPSPIVHTGDTWSFTTSPATPIVTGDPVSRTVPAGTTIDLNVTAQNATAYTWYQSVDAVADASDIVVGTGSTIQVTVNGLSQEGWYYCVVSNEVGSDTSKLCRIMMKRLVGWWPLDGDLTDAVATEVPGAPMHDGSVSEPNFVAGLPELGGQGYQFKGDGQVVTIADSIDYFNFYPQGMTVSCWVKGQNTAIWDCVVSKEYRPLDFTLANGFFLSRTDLGAGAFAIRPDHAISGNNLITVADWHHLAGVCDPVMAVNRIYIDGILQGEIAINPTNFKAPLVPLIFGAESSDGLYGPSSAMIDDIKIYNYALDPTQIAQQYVNVIGGQICVTAPVYDLNDDCQIDLGDFMLLASNWLESGIVQ